ncbi:hypothetical protein PsYK624_091040 [Phanerochaete sordida]|uniref:Uncharacterized protein n=1 Tax=Phanerochaete sordida TaxID=48140 RepID=A0A9P3GDU0_9APHY|nr:hypothetical protein PsYK624_091040 [Phanerochaete sordida]
MTAEDFCDAAVAAATLRQGAMDLARRLSSLRDFISAAHELAACNDLPPHHIKRHCRKIVTLIEIARTTLTRSGVQLTSARPCMPALARHRAAYLAMLHMLEAQRRAMQDDRAFQERVDRLLLPRAAPPPPRHGPAEESAGASAAHRCCRGAPPVFAPPPPPVVREKAAGGAMPPPDVLLGRPAQPWTPDAWTRDRPALPQLRTRAAWPGGDAGDDSDEDDEMQPVLLPQPRRRFGIFCTGKQGSRRPGGLRR